MARLIVFVLHLVAEGGRRGVEIKSRLFFTYSRRIGIFSEKVTAATRGAVTKARKKLSWLVFQQLFYDIVDIAYNFWPGCSEYYWHGMSVFAIDGSKFTLPAYAEIRQEFDPESGFENNGKGHYPQALISTVYDVFKRIPVARTIMPCDASERGEVKKLLPHIPHGILVFDRGYPSYELFLYLIKYYNGYFLFRNPYSETFPAVLSFIASSRIDKIIYISPSKSYMKKLSASERKKAKAIRIRALKVRYNGKITILLTNLFDKKEFPKKEIEQLYRDRWEVENYYRDEKVTMEIEKFHSRKASGIRQELFSAAIVSVISRIIMVLSTSHIQDRKLPKQTSTDSASDQSQASSSRNPKAKPLNTRKTKAEPQFSHSLAALAQNCAFLAADLGSRILLIFKELIQEVGEVLYYKPLERRPSQPRINKHPPNKWIEKRQKRLKEAENA